MRVFVRLVTLLLLPAAFSSGQTSPITLRADRLFDGRRMTSTPVRIVVEGGRIVGVEPEEGSQKRVGPAYDLSGLTILPGLIDSHAHLAWHFNRSGKLHTDTDGETAAQSALASAANAWATLGAGFTTVQSPGSPEDKDLRDAIASGGVPGPTILTSLEPLTEKDGDAEKLKQLVRERAQSGADLIKLFASKSIREGGAQTMSLEQLTAACGQA